MAARAFLPDAKSTFHAFPDGRLPAHWNEVKDAYMPLQLSYLMPISFLHRERTTPIKITG